MACRKQLDEGIDAEMGADLDAVGGADEDQLGEEVGGQLQSPDRARVEQVARDDLAEGDHRHAAEQQSEHGRASCRERVCQYVEISVGGVSLKKKHKETEERVNKR